MWTYIIYALLFIGGFITACLLSMAGYSEMEEKLWRVETDLHNLRKQAEDAGKTLDS